jgi:WD40 repeat protein
MMAGSLPMTADEALALLDPLLQTQSLRDLQEQVFRHAWEGRTYPNWARSMAFSPDGRTLASGSFDCTVRLWNVETGKCLQIFTDRDQAVNSVAFSSER